MKKQVTLTIAMLIMMTLTACDDSRRPDSSPSSSIQNSALATATKRSTTMDTNIYKEGEMMLTVIVQIGNNNLTAKLYDTPSTQALVKQLPLAIQMSELNGNEKYVFLPDDLPIKPDQVGEINAGDLMLYGSDCLVLFYESFSTSYSYTKLGYIENPSALADILGQGSVTVTFSIFQPNT